MPVPPCGMVRRVNMEEAGKAMESVRDDDTEGGGKMRGILFSADACRRVDCFNIEEEISYWRNMRDVFESPKLNHEDALYVDLIKFAYDSYVFYGRENYESARIHVMQRFSNSLLRRRCDWATADMVCGAVWTKMIIGLLA